MLAFAAIMAYIEECVMSAHAQDTGRGDGLAVESRPRNPGAGVQFLVSAAAGRHSSALSTLNYCVVLTRWCCAVLCPASNHGIACALRLGPTQPVTDFWG